MNKVMRLEAIKDKLRSIEIEADEILQYSDNSRVNGCASYIQTIISDIERLIER